MERNDTTSDAATGTGPEADTDIDSATTELILDVLVKAAAAHGVHEAEVLGGVYDEEWPQWYAAHIARALAEGGYRIIRTTER